MLSEKMNLKLTTVHKWTTANKILVNPQKSHCLIIPHKKNHRISNISIYFNDSVININDTVKYLGITVDNKLIDDLMMMIDWCIFILLSRESDGALYFGRIRTRLGVDHFPSFPVDVLTSSHVNLLLVRSHQAEIIIVKRLIQGRNNVTRVRVELMTLRSESS